MLDFERLFGPALGEALRVVELDLFAVVPSVFEKTSFWQGLAKLLQRISPEDVVGPSSSQPARPSLPIFPSTCSSVLRSVAPQNLGVWFELLAQRALGARLIPRFCMPSSAAGQLLPKFPEVITMALQHLDDKARASLRHAPGTQTNATQAVVSSLAS